MVVNSAVRLTAPLLALALVGVRAQASDPVGDSLGERLAHCRTLGDPTARLACYDGLTAPAARSAEAAKPASGTSRTVAGTPSAPATQAVDATGNVPPQPAATDTSAANFGVRNGPLEVKRNPVREKRMLAVVSGVSGGGFSGLVVTLDNGQVWVQNEPSDFPIKPGDHIEIDVGALGSYVLWSPSVRRAMKVNRIR
jgi:hypothetical protein